MQLISFQAQHQNRVSDISQQLGTNFISIINKSKIWYSFYLFRRFLFLIQRLCYYFLEKADKLHFKHELTEKLTNLYHSLSDFKDFSVVS